MTRRELREREAAEALRAAGAQQPVGAPAEQPADVSWQALFTPAAAPVQAAATPVQAPVQPAPVQPAPVQPAPVQQAAAPAAAVWHPSPAAQVAPTEPGALRPRRSAAAVPPSPVPFIPLAATPSAPAPQAEPVDRPVDTVSAFADSRVDISPSHPAPSQVDTAPQGGFDALFAGLGEEPEPAAERPARSARPSRAERKAAKAAPVPRRTSAVAAPAAEAAAPVDDFAAVIAASAVAGASLVTPAPREAEAADLGAAPPADAAWQPSTGTASAQRPRRTADTGARRATGRELPAAGATDGSSRPAPKRRVKRASRIARVSSGFAAMSFAALLAVATSVPSLSLLSPADVQAIALEQSTRGTEPGQVVEITGGALAQTVQRDGYETQTIDEYARAAGIRPEATFTNNPSGTIQWPFAVGVHIGDRFGYRDCAGCSSDHGGQDFNPGLGAEIQSIADGVVANSTDSGGSLGVVMMIDHMIDGELVTSVYAHMEYGSRRFETGDTVKVGDVIGQTGDTGMSTGPHLHFEIRVGGMSGIKVDPLEWLYANTN
ncbi:peptidoglycan DD-metalloendopeptidase family protein [Agromyces sp. Root81]|uniref:peptidoglycan DD-metalloendopeptidase family protein n=1 Tax=Agromyces sp. Root81 TaxID=1736601 RepID=UPI0012F8C7FF|nr:peptidoglycan DD-metalloendopeptidase family protein [Agromyces sp. Root81]